MHRPYNLQAKLNKYFKINTSRMTRVISAFMLVFLIFANPALATPQDDLNQINNEINNINSQLSTIGSQKKSLANEVAAFDAQIYVIQLKINAVQTEIDITTSKIADTNTQIEKAELDLIKQKDILQEYIKIMYMDGQTSQIELILTSNSFSDFVDQSQYMDTMTQKIQETTLKIESLKLELDTKKKQLEVDNAKNEQLKAEQVAARGGVESQKASKDQLLQATKGQESGYKSLLADAQKRQADAFQEYLRSIEGASSSGGSTYIGGSGSGYLSAPLQAYVTQGYGCTDFAQCGNPYGPYGGSIHNGIDIASYINDPIHAAADGEVLDVGGEYNSQGWGNWIAIRHPNGLVTFYGHLNSFAVSPGQSVSRGQVIGFEGSTGFSTGAHLHFSVYTNFILYNTAGYHGPNYNGSVNPYTFL